MPTDVQGRALAVLSKVAQADWPDRLKLRQPFEKLLYVGSRQSFRLAASRGAGKAKGPRPASAASADGLFDLSLSDEQQMLSEMLGSFADEVLRPAAHEADSRQAVPAEILLQARELGLSFYGVPEAHGGMAGERTLVTNALIAESLGRGDLGLAASLLVPLSAANCIRRWASPEQQAQWLPAFASEAGAEPHALAVTEPQLLADPMRLQTQARKRGGHYLLSGEKSLVLQGLNASRLLVAAQTAKGPALFWVDAAGKGVSRQAEPAMGLKCGALARIRFKSARAERLAGADFDYRAFLDLSALAWCALAVGTCQAALDYVIPYCNERTAFGEPISHRQGVAFMIADMAIELDAMRLMVWRACARAERGESFHREAYLARLLCAEKAMRIGTDAVQLLGGHGFTQEHPVERWYRDLRAVAIQAGGLHL